MEQKVSSGKRGRPRKYPAVAVSTLPKRKRGRPSKQKSSVRGIENIEVKDIDNEIVGRELEIIEDYIPPKILRKKRVFRFDRKTFHAFSKKFDGDIVIMSYVFNELMKKFIDNKIKINKKIYTSDYYFAWGKINPLIEPIVYKEIHHAEALTRGIPLHYKYPLLIDDDIFSLFERKCPCYPAFVSCYLLHEYMKGSISINVSKAKEWCVI